MKTETDILTHWQTVADAVSFDSTATIDSFNSEIHREIITQEHKDQKLALELLRIKFDINKRYYQHRRAHGK